MYRVIPKIIPVCLLGLVGTFAHDAFPLSGPGLMMKAYYPADSACISGSSYGGIVNTCNRAVFVDGTLTVAPGSHATRISVFGNSTNCRSSTVGGNSNAYQLGDLVWTPAGPKAWHSLNTGVRSVPIDHALVFECLLEPQGKVSIFTAD
jgi:hypothetical protein